MEMQQSESNPDFVLSLARGLQVIEAFHGERHGLSVSDVAERAALSRAAARRLLITLEMLGYAERRGSSFHLTSRVLRLGFSFVTSNSLGGAAVPVLEQLRARIHESCSISILEGGEIVYLARAAARRVMTIDLGVGSRLPAYCTSMGRVLLAALPDTQLEKRLESADLKPLTAKTITDPAALCAILRKTREQGYAIVDEELELGLRSIAVPVATRSGEVLAAMNSGVASARMTVVELAERILPPLREHAKLLGDMLS